LTDFHSKSYSADVMGPEFIGYDAAGEALYRYRGGVYTGKELEDTWSVVAPPPASTHGKPAAFS
jgi:hypothetical protein